MSNQKHKKETRKSKSRGRFGSGLLVDNVKQVEQGKLDCYGVFTFFWAWGYPCNRSWNVVFTMFELPEGKIPISIWMKPLGAKTRKKLKSIKLEIGEPDGAATFFAPVNYRFGKAGRYIIECSVEHGRNKLQIPFEVRTKDWPRFTKKEIEFARNNPAIPRVLRANVHCFKCDYGYIFEETILPDVEPPGGIMRFPEAGKLKCEGCGHTMNLRDIQGQLRASLKSTISQAMVGK